jgi:hypothetical protein
MQQLISRALLVNKEALAARHPLWPLHVIINCAIECSNGATINVEGSRAGGRSKMMDYQQVFPRSKQTLTC